MANRTPNTPGVSETELRAMKVDELRDAARDEGVRGAADMRKEELVRAVADARSNADADGSEAVHTGPGSSSSVKYSQVISSPDDEPEREGRSLVTTDHDVIRQWAEARKGTP